MDRPWLGVCPRLEGVQTQKCPRFEVLTDSRECTHHTPNTHLQFWRTHHNTTAVERCYAVIEILTCEWAKLCYVVQSITDCSVHTRECTHHTHNTHLQLWRTHSQHNWEMLCNYWNFDLWVSKGMLCSSKHRQIAVQTCTHHTPIHTYSYEGPTHKTAEKCYAIIEVLTCEWAKLCYVVQSIVRLQCAYKRVYTSHSQYTPQ